MIDDFPPEPTLFEALATLDRAACTADAVFLNRAAQVIRDHIDLLHDQRATVLHLHVSELDVRGREQCGECWLRWPCPTAAAMGVTK